MIYLKTLVKLKLPQDIGIIIMDIRVGKAMSVIY